MKKTELMTTATRKLNKIAFSFKKHSPEILVVAGVVGVVASGVMACKATTKLDSILDKAKDDIDKIKHVAEHPETVNEEYTEEDSKKDMAIVYTKTAVDLVKLYAPAVTLGALSIGCIITSNGILRKRNIALAAAYTAVDKGFKEYRGRVIERFGEELDKELRFNVKAKEIEERVVDEDGNEKTETVTVNVAGPIDHSVFARCFDETCEAWVRDANANMVFLKQQQNFLNERLRTKGMVSLNEVYEALGFQKTKEGHVVGWVYDEKNPVGDNFIDFGIYNIHSEAARRFVNGYEKSIWLDFNVDSYLLNYL